MRTGFAGQLCASACDAAAAAKRNRRVRSGSAMREFYSVGFSLFAVFSEVFEGIPPLISGVPGLEKVHIYTPGRAHDPFLDDGSPPPLALQLYFDSLSSLEAAIAGSLSPIKAICKVQAMLVRPFAVAEPREDPLCTYLV